MLIHRILGGLHLSSIDPINNEVDLKTEHGITHILSVVPGPMNESYLEDYKWKQIEVTDEETTNLVPYFQDSYDFIDSALFKDATDKKHQGNVLVHCSQGVSRSVAFIIAYLMQKYNLSIEQALHAVKRKSPDAGPNPRFMEQLTLYKEMGFKVDESNPEYQALLKKITMTKDPSGEELRKMMLAKTETEIPEKEAVDSSYELRCKRCRQVLANNTHIEQHEVPGSDSRQSQFVKTAPNSRRIISVEKASNVCSHYFMVEPVRWMKEELDKSEIEGRFQCPKCSSKVGGYSWRGSRCSCGKWMTPAIHLQEAKVDYIKKN
ncbi:Tyrosine-protein phosphatase YVH1 [Candida viswanathii]|uniref:protein-tyrosine-phosphatase n=1 Tax=Candida viswanathii TaxID=5486 RepID=A0A367Y0K4_9ASCO|nr:Tyrosine-protein phosphatase YVH1 [Candida viswanathii]